MVKALIWKHWAELRPLRWAGLALGAVLPAALIAGAEAGTRGWLPSGTVGSYSTRTIFFDVMPLALAVGLWPLIGLLVSAQAFAGDRASGTETFLLSRPVPRGRTWWARLLASGGSALFVAAGSLALWGLLAGVLAEPGAAGWAPALKIFVTWGALTLVAALTAGTLAASMASAPFAGLLLGLLVGVVPFWLSAVLVTAFPYAEYRGILLGAVVVWLLPVGFLVTSRRMLCRGEPLGRGRWKRGSVALAVSCVACGLVFVSAAPLAVRSDARRTLVEEPRVIPSPVPGRAVLWNGNSGWLVDLRDGGLGTFLAPPALPPAWNADGTRLAVGTMSGPLGSMPSARLDLFDPEGRLVTAAGYSFEHSYPYELSWAGTTLVGRYFGVKRGGVMAFDVTGGFRRIPVDLPSGSWTPVGPTLAGELYVARSDDDPFAPVGGDEDATAGDAADPIRYRPVAYGLYRVNLAAGRIDPEPMLQDRGLPMVADRRLSPSGRYWQVDDANRGAPRPLLDLHTGRRTPFELPASLHLNWLVGDGVMWVETRDNGAAVMIAAPDGAPRELREFRAAPSVQVSLDRRQVLLTTFAAQPPRGTEPGATGVPHPAFTIVRAEWVYDVVADRFQELPPWPERPARGHRRYWADPRTLARVAPGYIALEPLDRPGELIPVLGQPPG